MYCKNFKWPEKDGKSICPNCLSKIQYWQFAKSDETGNVWRCSNCIDQPRTPEEHQAVRETYEKWNYIKDQSRKFGESAARDNEQKIIDIINKRYEEL